MTVLLFDADRRDGFERTDQLRREMRRWVDGGGMLDSWELNSMTWVARLWLDGRYAFRWSALARLRAVELDELDQAKRTAPHSVPLKR